MNIRFSYKVTNQIAQDYSIEGRRERSRSLTISTEDAVGSIVEPPSPVSHFDIEREIMIMKDEKFFKSVWIYILIASYAFIMFYNILPAMSLLIILPIFIYPALFELGYVLLQEKNIKKDFSVKRYWGFFFLFYGIKALIK